LSYDYIDRYIDRYISVFQGYNNWVPGIYGYSWDMMVHAWDTLLVVIKVHDNVNNEVRYLDPDTWVQSNRWLTHGDMALQYSQCLKVLKCHK